MTVNDNEDIAGFIEQWWDDGSPPEDRPWPDILPPRLPPAVHPRRRYAYTTQEDPDMTSISPKARETRVSIGRALMGSLGSDSAAMTLDISESRTWLTEDSMGPNGGTSTQVLALLDIDGELIPVAINIYAEEALMPKIMRAVEDEKADNKIREAVGFKPAAGSGAAELEEK